MVFDSEFPFCFFDIYGGVHRCDETDGGIKMEFNIVYETMRRNPGKQYAVKELAITLHKNQNSIRRMLHSLSKFGVIRKIDMPTAYHQPKQKWVIKE